MVQAEAIRNRGAGAQEKFLSASCEGRPIEISHQHQRPGMWWPYLGTTEVWQNFGLANDLEPMVLPIQSMLSKKHPEAFGHMFTLRHLSDRIQIRPETVTYGLKIWAKKF